MCAIECCDGEIGSWLGISRMARSLCYMAHREKQQYEEGKELLCAPGLTVCCLHLRAVVWLEDEFLFFFSPINPSRPVPYDSTDIEVKAVELFLGPPRRKNGKRSSTGVDIGNASKWNHKIPGRLSTTPFTLEPSPKCVSSSSPY
jgi:hypothetical protein